MAGPYRPKLVVTTTEEGDKTFWDTSSDGEIRVYGAGGVSYATVHDAATGTVDDTDTELGVASSLVEKIPSNRYRVRRGFLFFDTSDLAGLTVTAAVLTFWTSSVQEVEDNHGDLHVVEGVQDDPLAANDYGDHLTKTTSGGSVAIPTAAPYGNYADTEWDITLNATGRGWINLTGTTKLCLRVEGDIDDTTPTVIPGNYWDIYSNEGAGTSVTAPTCTTDTPEVRWYKSIEYTLKGTCTDDGGEACEYRFQYGPTDAYGTDTAWAGAINTDDEFEEVVEPRPWYKPGDVVHYRAQVKNSDSTGSGADTEGRRRQQWHSVKGLKKDAERKLRELLSTLDAGTYIKPTKLTVAEFLRQWLRDYASVNVRPRTLERHESAIRHYLIPLLGAIALADLKPEHIQRCHAKALQKLAPSTVVYHHRVLSQALSHAVKWGLITRNVAQAVKPPRKANRKMRILTVDEIQALLVAVSGTIYHALFHLALFTGMRRSELLGLRWKSVDLDLANVSVVQGLHKLDDGRIVFDEPKSHHGRRQVALSPEAVSSLRRHREQQEAQAIFTEIPLTDDSFVFSDLDGRPLLPHRVSHTFAKMVTRLGITGVRFHDLRHTHASLMLQQGVHPKIVSERLGHSSVAITLDIYSHVIPGLQEAAAKRFDDAMFAKGLQTAT